MGAQKAKPTRPPSGLRPLSDFPRPVIANHKQTSIRTFFRDQGPANPARNIAVPESNTFGSQAGFQMPFRSRGVSEEDDDDDDYQEDSTDDGDVEHSNPDFVQEYLDALKFYDSQNKLLPSLKACPWILPPNPLSSFIENDRIDFKPFLLPRVFVWIPQTFFPLADHMPFCFKCKTILRPNGLSTGFRRVYDLRDIFYLKAQSFICTNVMCDVGSFSSADARFVSSLPKEIRYQFPAVTTSKCGISRDLADLQMSLDPKGIGPSRFRSTVLELHSQEFDRKMVQYYGAARSRLEATHEPLPITNRHLVPLFPDFGDMYKVPGSNYFKTAFINVCRSMRSYWDFSIQRLDSKILKVDHTFEVKLVDLDMQKNPRSAI